jgi:NADH dehydrogenase FAD-containing subunit
MDVVLVGAGHAHLLVALAAERFVRAGARLTVVDPGTFWYSGLATGVLGGMYEPTDDQIDPARLVESRGGRLVVDRVVEVVPEERVLRLASGESLRYDVASVDIGSEVPIADLPGAGEHALAVKPIPNLWRLRQRLEQRFARGAGTRVVVVGGGATAGEVAANLRALALAHGASLAVTLLSRSGRLVPRHSDATSRSLLRALRQRDVAVELGCAAARIEADGVLAADGRRFAADLVVVATGLRAAALPGLPRPLCVDANLRVVGAPRLFGAGDCIDFDGRDLPKLGVFGVRQAPVLLHNLLATVGGAPLRRYVPQRRCLAILNLGRGEAFATWGAWHARGRWCLCWKDWLDRGFLARCRRAPR